MLRHLLDPLKRPPAKAGGLVSTELLCTGWAAYSHTPFTGNHIKDTIYALWETSLIVQHPVTTTFVLLLALVVLVTMSLKSTSKLIQSLRAVHSFASETATVT